MPNINSASFQLRKKEIRFFGGIRATFGGTRGLAKCPSQVLFEFWNLSPFYFPSANSWKECFRLRVLA